MSIRIMFPSVRQKDRMTMVLGEFENAFMNGADEGNRRLEFKDTVGKY